MLKSVNSRRLALALALAMLAVPVLGAPMAEAGEKQRNVVQCPTEPDGFSCRGTKKDDYLVGTPNFDVIRGKGGNDTYEGKGASDTLIDESTSSNDKYVFKGTNPFGEDTISDCGGVADLVNLGSTSFRLFENVTTVRPDTTAGCGPAADDLRISGPEGVVFIANHYGAAGKIEGFRFANTR